MDWTIVRGGPGRHPAEPRLDLLETCWRLRWGNRTLTCGIYRTNAPGVELRASFSDDDLIRSQHLPDVPLARQFAAEWRQAVIDKGGEPELAS